MVAAQGGDRLALLSLGYKHYQGVNIYPQDLELSYTYYRDAAVKTERDQHAAKEDQVKEKSVIGIISQVSILVHVISFVIFYTHPPLK